MRIEDDQFEPNDCEFKWSLIHLHGFVEQVEQAMEAAVEEDEEIDEDEYFMRKFLLEQVSLSLPLSSTESVRPSADQTTDEATLAETDTAVTGSTDTAAGVVLPLDRTTSNTSANLGSPLPSNSKVSKTPPKPRLKTPRKRRAKLNLESTGPTTTARMVGIESYKEHVKGNVMIRAKACVFGLPIALQSHINRTVANTTCDRVAWDIIRRRIVVLQVIKQVAK